MDGTPGPWWTVLTDEKKVRQTYVMCPECGKLAGIGPPMSDHVIHSDGRVDGSLLCPTKGCGWHQNIRLESFSI